MKTDFNQAVLNRIEYVTKRALKFALSQGYSEATAYAFAAFAVEHCPEVQGYTNLFDYFMSYETHSGGKSH